MVPDLESLTQCCHIVQTPRQACHFWYFSTKNRKKNIWYWFLSRLSLPYVLLVFQYFEFVLFVGLLNVLSISGVGSSKKYEANYLEIVYSASYFKNSVLPRFFKSLAFPQSLRYLHESYASMKKSPFL